MQRCPDYTASRHFRYEFMNAALTGGDCTHTMHYLHSYYRARNFICYFRMALSPWLQYTKIPRRFLSLYIQPITGWIVHVYSRCYPVLVVWKFSREINAYPTHLALVIISKIFCGCSSQKPSHSAIKTCNETKNKIWIHHLFSMFCIFQFPKLPFSHTYSAISAEFWWIDILYSMFVQYYWSVLW